MPLNHELQKKLNRRYEPSSMVSMRFKGNDVSFKTDEEGNPVLLFIGRKNEKGIVKGERYARTLQRDKEGNVIRDHWEQKGKAT